MENKKAIAKITTPMLFLVVIFSIIVLVSLGIFSYGFRIADDSISSIDFMIGNQSFNDTYQQIVHPGLEALSITGPRIMSMGILIGMVLVILFIGMKSDIKSKLWIIIDIFIIIFAEMLAVAVKTTFENDLLNLTPELFEVFTTTLSAGSKWILNMPTIIPTVGVLLLIATYVLKKQDQEEESDGFIEIEGE